MDASASDVVPALTPEGLMPFSNNYGYVVPLDKNFINIKDEVLIFGAASFMFKCLTHTYVNGDGHTITEKLSEFEQERLINASLFRIVNSCKMRRSVLQDVCVYYYSTYYKAVREGGGGGREDMCYERLRAEDYMN